MTMSYLVFRCNCRRLENLSGVSSAREEFDPAQTTAHPVIAGDNMYFLRIRMNAP
jgi:hypothetical protein